jgi:hypothetical protein
MPSRERSLRLATDSLVPFAPEYRKFPVAGSLQRISSNRGLPARRLPEKAKVPQSVKGEFPTHPNREFFKRLQGIKSGDQGTIRRHQGKRAMACVLL